MCLSKRSSGFLIEKRLKDLDIKRLSSLLTRTMLLALELLKRPSRGREWARVGGGCGDDDLASRFCSSVKKLIAFRNLFSRSAISSRFCLSCMMSATSSFARASWGGVASNSENVVPLRPPHEVSERLRVQKSKDKAALASWVQFGHCCASGSRACSARLAPQTLEAKPPLPGLATPAHCERAQVPQTGDQGAH